MDMSQQRPPFIKRVSDITPFPYVQEHPPGGQGQIIGLSRATGGEKIGADILIVEPNQVLSYFHWHTEREEFFYILRGSCSVRVGKASYRLQTGDVMTCKAQMGEGHQFVNDSDNDVWILAIDTQEDNDEVYRPELGTIFRRSDESIALIPKAD